MTNGSLVGGSSAVDAFLAKVEGKTSLSGSSQRGRLIFALDATMSRQPTWDTACKLQVGMFKEAAAIGGLEVQLVYYRGTSECQASRWISRADQLGGIMERIHVLAGETQIRRILTHSLRETRRSQVHAIVFVGDAMEESGENLYGKAQELGRLSTPMFVFQEGRDEGVEQVFCRIAQLTNGAYAVAREELLSD